MNEPVLRELVALVDDRLCSFAAVRWAISFASSVPTPVVVLLAKPRIAWCAQFVGILGAPFRDESDDEVFRLVSAMIAPFDISWDFMSAESYLATNRVAECRDDDSVLAIAVSHRNGHSRPFRSSGRRIRTDGRLTRATMPLLVVGCDGT
jgi:hypothetical protein